MRDFYDFCVFYVEPGRACNYNGKHTPSFRWTYIAADPAHATLFIGVKMTFAIIKSKEKGGYQCTYFTKAFV